MNYLQLLNYVQLPNTIKLIGGGKEANEHHGFQGQNNKPRLLLERKETSPD